MATQLDRLRGYVGNLGVKTPVDVATTANITLSGEQTIDGITTAESRVLVWKQTTQSQNGVYISSTGPWVRAADMDGDYDLEAGTFVNVGRGTTQNGNVFMQITPDPVIDTSNIVFVNLAAYVSTQLNGVVGIDVEGRAQAALLNAAYPTLYRGIQVNNTGLLSYNNYLFELNHNFDGDGNRRIADGSTTIRITGESLAISSYPTGTAGTAAINPTEFYLYPQAMLIGTASQRLPPAGEYQIGLFGQSWISGAMGEALGRSLTISQGAYKNTAGNYLYGYIFVTDEASQFQLRDGLAILRCAPAGVNPNIVTFTDVLTASITGVSITGNLAVSGTITGEVNLQGVVGIGTEGIAQALLLEAASAGYRGISLNNTAFLSYNDTYFSIEHNIDANFNLRRTDGATWIYCSGEDFYIYTYASGTAGTAATGQTYLRLRPQSMVIGSGTARTPPANEYQIALFGNSWMHGATSETAGQVLTLSQGSYKNVAGNFIHAFTDEASQVVLRDGTVVLKCAASAAGGSTVTFVDALTASPTLVTLRGDLRLSGSSSGYVGLKAAAAAGSTTYTLPSADGVANQVLSTNGSGTWVWATNSTMSNVEIVTGATSVGITLSTGTWKLQIVAYGFVSTNPSGNALELRRDTVIKASGGSLTTAAENVTLTFAEALSPGGSTLYTYDLNVAGGSFLRSQISIIAIKTA